MSTLRVPQSGVTCASSLVVTNIIDGKPWTAASIKNNHLRQHCHILGRAFAKPNQLTDTLKPSFRRLLCIATQRSHLLTHFHPDKLDCVTLLLRVANYADRWLRPPESWQPDQTVPPASQWRSLLAHLFQAYPLPEFFDSAWFTFGALAHLERDWYCHVAAGGSLRRAPGMPRSVSARALHRMLRAPGKLTIRQALRWGQAQAAGCSRRLTWEILRSAMVNDLSHDGLWSRLLQKIAAAAHFPARDWSLLVDGLQYTLKREGLPKALRLLDLPWRDLRNHCRMLFVSCLHVLQSDGGIFGEVHLKKSAFRQELLHLAQAVWPTMPKANRVAIIYDPDTIWSFHELNSLSQLLLETKIHKHCVASYRKHCQSGSSAIFSMRGQSVHSADVTRRLTLEVDRRSREITQVRGRWNRRAYDAENRAIARWAEQNKLTY